MDLEQVDLEPLFSEAEIQAMVKRMAKDLSRDLQGQRPLLLGILKGSFVFLADLARELDLPFDIDFIRARSYGTEMRTSGAVEITKDVETDLIDRHVVVVEDIADTGLTMDVVVDRIRAGKPASIRRCALLVREGCDPPDYLGTTVGPGFVVGYGIDYAEEYRGLRDIKVIAGTTEP